MNFVRAGRAFILYDRKMGEHLWFILTDPDAETGRIVIVAVVSAKSHTDKTVTLVPGDHPFIVHESNVDYGTATFRPESKMDSHLKSGVAALQPDMSRDLLVRVRAGLVASAHTPHDVTAHCAPVFGG